MKRKNALFSPKCAIITDAFQAAPTESDFESTPLITGLDGISGFGSSISRVDPSDNHHLGSPAGLERFWSIAPPRRSELGTSRDRPSRRFGRELIKRFRRTAQGHEIHWTIHILFAIRSCLGVGLSRFVANLHMSIHDDGFAGLTSWSDTNP